MQFRNERSLVQVASEERVELCKKTALHRTCSGTIRHHSFLVCVSFSLLVLCVVATSRVARLTLQTRKLWLVGVVTDRELYL